MDLQTSQYLANFQNWIDKVIENYKKPHEFTEVTDTETTDEVIISRNQQVYKMSIGNLVSTKIKDKVINVGTIANDVTINTHINTNDSTDWDLKKDTTYFFEGLHKGLLYRWIYVGDKPKYLGSSEDPTANADDFILWSVNKFYIESGGTYGWIKKGNNNTNQTVQEVGDDIFNKELIDGSYLLAHTYSSDNGSTPEQNIDNYTVKNLDI